MQKSPAADHAIGAGLVLLGLLASMLISEHVPASLLRATASQVKYRSQALETQPVG